MCVFVCSYHVEFIVCFVRHTHKKVGNHEGAVYFFTALYCICYSGCNDIYYNKQQTYLNVI